MTPTTRRSTVLSSAGSPLIASEIPRPGSVEVVVSGTVVVVGGSVVVVVSGTVAVVIVVSISAASLEEQAEARITAAANSAANLRCLGFMHGSIGANPSNPR